MAEPENDLKAYLAWLEYRRHGKPNTVFCAHDFGDGTACKFKAMDGTPWCRVHNPERAEARRKAQIAGKRRKKVLREWSVSALLDSMGIKH